MNGGKFDGGQLTQDEKDLRDFYKRLLNFSINSSALMGKFEEIQTPNRQYTQGYDPGIYSFVRWSDAQKLIVVTNFSWLTTSNFELKVPADLIKTWKLKDGNYPVKDQMYGKGAKLEVVNGEGKLKITIAPSESFIYSL